MNGRADTYHKNDSKISFWDSKRKGTNFMNSTSLPGNFKFDKKETE